MTNSARDHLLASHALAKGEDKPDAQSRARRICFFLPLSYLTSSLGLSGLPEYLATWGGEAIFTSGVDHALLRIGRPSIIVATFDIEAWLQLEAALAGDSDAARGDGAVAPSAGASCCFCSRRGVPEKSRVREVLAGAFGPHVPDRDGPHDVVVEFSAAKAQLVSSREWHPSQRVTESSDGRVRVGFRVPSLAPIVSWVLEWGPHVRVIAMPYYVFPSTDLHLITGASVPTRPYGTIDGSWPDIPASEDSRCNSLGSRRPSPRARLPVSRRSLSTSLRHRRALV